MEKLSVFMRALNAQTMQPVSYNRVLFAILAGRIPAEQRRGRWYASLDAVPAAAELLATDRRRSA